MIRTFIQITSLVLTLQAALFLAKGSLGLSADTIADLSSTKWGHNSGLVASLSQQRADTWVGAAFLLFAFFFQMANALWPMRWVDVGVHKGAAAYALIFSIVLGFGAHFLAQELARHTALEVKKHLDRSGPPPETTVDNSE